MAKKRYELTDEQWDRVSGLIKHSKMGRPPKDDQVMRNAMLWMARSGAGWEDLPERYGPWKTVYSRFCKWQDDGTFVRIFTALNKDADMENLSLDSTSVKAHQHSAGAKKGCKQRSQTIYWHQSRRQDNKNSRNCRRTGKSALLSVVGRKYP